MNRLESVLEVTDLLDKRISYVLVEDDEGAYAVVIRPRRGNWECTMHPRPDGLAADCEHARQAAAFVNPSSEDRSRFLPDAKPLSGAAYVD